MDTAKERPDIAALRDKLLAGLTAIDDFAAAIDKHPKTLMRMNPPIVRIGRNVYVPEEEGRAWILNGCKPLQPERRARAHDGRSRRPGAAA